MAEPTNTPLPTAPGTPISATPRSASPTQHHHHHFFQHPPIPTHLIINSSRNTSVDHGTPGGLDSIIASTTTSQSDKPTVLILSDEGQHNSGTPSPIGETCEALRPSANDRSRGLFISALRERKWGDFFAVVQPASSSNEPGDWDEELISLLPSSVKLFISARGGSDRVDIARLRERGIDYVTFEELAMRMIMDVHAGGKGF